MDVLRCAQCGGKVEILAFVTDPDLAAEILARLGLTSPARGHQPADHPLAFGSEPVRPA